MPVKVLFTGTRHAVCAWVDEGEQESAVETFILELYAGNDTDSEAMVNELEKTSNHGPSRNVQKFRYLKGAGEGLVEFKARGGSRILAFMDQNRRRIICTHGIPKLKKRRFDREIAKAHRVRNDYLIECLEEGSKYVN